ncbi:MAG: NfeD family protein [Cytophagales bacterium]|nr:NfeD family protein [Cytophagales bacterium]
MKKILVTILLLYASILCAADKIFYFKLDAEIDPRASRLVDIALKEAINQSSDIVLLELNTFGGAVNDADHIRTALLNHPVPVWVFINKNAASAGALISIACDSIYMAAGASMGAATVVNGEGAVVPEKYQSYMRSMMRATAEANKRNPILAEAMVDPDVDTDTIIKKSGKVLTFTTLEAINNNFCEAEAKNIHVILALNNCKDATLYKYEPSVNEKIISFFLNPVISSVLILIILGGIYFELQTPGVGFPLIAAIVAALLYFVPYYLNGLAQNWEIMIFIIGVLLLALEFFVIPGFGIAGISGIIFMVSALILSMLNNDWLNFDMVNSNSIGSAIYITFITLCATTVLVILGTRQLLKSKKFKQISLHDTKIDADVMNQSHIKALIGKQGTCITDLKPSGKVEIEQAVYDAYTSGEYIANGTNIVVKEVFNNTVKVSVVS